MGCLIRIFGDRRATAFSVQLASSSDAPRRRPRQRAGDAALQTPGRSAWPNSPALPPEPLLEKYACCCGADATTGVNFSRLAGRRRRDVLLALFFARWTPISIEKTTRRK